MPEQWMSVAEAAAAMKVHPRTVERRIVAGKIESRRNDDGQVQILVNVPEPVETFSDNAIETVREIADRQVDIAAGSASALVRIAQEQTLRAENQLMIARQDAGRYRRETQFATAFTALMLLLVVGAVGWCTHILTSAKDEARLAADRAMRATHQTRVLQEENQATRNRLDDALVGQAKAEGELAAYKTELSTVVEQTKEHAVQHAAATTQPTNLVSRLTQMFAGINN